MKKILRSKAFKPLQANEIPSFPQFFQQDRELFSRLSFQQGLDRVEEHAPRGMLVKIILKLLELHIFDVVKCFMKVFEG